MPEPNGLSPDAETLAQPAEQPDSAPTLDHGGAGRPGGRDLRTVPGYHIDGELGRGGMGVVYRARQLRLNRTVALKMILSGGHAGPGELLRFLGEAEAAAALQHPNIVGVYEVGEHDGLPYLALEYCPGGSLAQRLTAGPMAPAQAAELVAALARAVAAAHSADVIHRDLKPGNVLFAADGTPKLADFGLAKRVGSAEGLTATGAVMGTPGYMAPEQALGEAKRVGPAADVFALGAVFYHLLTGRPPFQSSNALEAILMTVERDPVAPSQLVPKLPRDLEVICLKCLEKDPAKRYAMASELADDLGRWQRGEPTRAKPPTAWQAARMWLRRNMRSAALVVAVGLVTGALAGWAVYFDLIRRPLNACFEQGYALLPATGRPWLAGLLYFGPSFDYVVIIPALLAITVAGLAVVMLARPTSPGSDLAHGLAAGLVAAFAAFFLGGAWAFAGGGVLNALYDKDHLAALRENGLELADGRLVYTSHDATAGDTTVRVYQPGWQAERYPDLKGAHVLSQRQTLYSKMAFDALTGVQSGLLKGFAAFFLLFVVAIGFESLVAGQLWRRDQRVGPVAAAYAERIVPLVMALIFSVLFALSAAEFHVEGDRFIKFQRVYWHVEALIALALLAAVAAWRGWAWPVRTALHLLWAVLVPYAIAMRR